VALKLVVNEISLRETGN